VLQQPHKAIEPRRCGLDLHHNVKRLLAILFGVFAAVVWLIGRTRAFSLLTVAPREQCKNASVRGGER
jgi:hypothetical protein